MGRFGTLALFLFIFLLPLNRLSWFPYLHEGSSLLLMFAALGVWWRNRPKLRTLLCWPILIPLGVLIVWSFASTTWAIRPSVAVEEGIRHLIFTGIVLAILILRPTPRTLGLALLPMVLLQSVTAVFQLVNGHPMGLFLLGEMPFLAERGKGPVILAGETYWLRGYGLTRYPNILGGILLAALIWLAFAYLVEKKRPIRNLLLTGVIIGIVGAFVTLSRSAWLGGAVAGGITLLLIGQRLWQENKQQLMVLLTTVIATLLLCLLFWSPLVLTRTQVSATHTEQTSIQERTDLNAGAVELIRQRGWLGVGAGNYAFGATDIMEGARLRIVHNTPLLVTGELGIVGAIVSFWLMVLPFLYLWRGRKSLTVWQMGVSAVLILFTIIHLFDSYTWVYPSARHLYWFSWGIWTATFHQNQPI